MRRSLVVVIAIALAMVGPAGAATDPGERAYAEACASCHRVPSRVLRPYLSMTREQRRLALDVFLKDHYAEDDATRAAIIAWLEANHVRR